VGSWYQGRVAAAALPGHCNGRLARVCPPCVAPLCAPCVPPPVYAPCVPPLCTPPVSPLCLQAILRELMDSLLKATTTETRALLLMLNAVMEVDDALQTVGPPPPTWHTPVTACHGLALPAAPLTSLLLCQGFSSQASETALACRERTCLVLLLCCGDGGLQPRQEAIVYGIPVLQPSPSLFDVLFSTVKVRPKSPLISKPPLLMHSHLTVLEREEPDLATAYCTHVRTVQYCVSWQTHSTELCSAERALPERVSFAVLGSVWGLRWGCRT